MLERTIARALRDARPVPPAGFDARSDAQLLRLTTKEERPVKKVSGLVLVLALLLGMTAAVAANWWGIADFLNNDDLGDLVTPVDASVQTAHAIFTVTEQIYDGRGIYLAVNVRPAEAGTLLLPGGTSVDAQAGTLIPGQEGTLAEYARGQGYDRSAWVAVYALPEGGVPVYLAQRAHLEPDGTLTLLLSTTGEAYPDSLPLTLLCASDTLDRGDTQVWHESAGASCTRLPLVLACSAAAERTYVSAAPVEFVQLGITLNQLKLTVTPLATYYEIDYTAPAPVTGKGEPGWVFRFLREDGTSYPAGGVARISRHTVLDEASGRCLWRGTLDPIAEMPESVTLKGYRGSWAAWDAEESQPIPLVQAR